MRMIFYSDYPFAFYQLHEMRRLALERDGKVYEVFPQLYVHRVLCFLLDFGPREERIRIPPGLM